MAIKKVINSSTQQFEPVLVDKLVLDAVPTVNSFNSVTSDAVARAVAGASGEVPQVTESDNGKVLKAIYDAGGPAVEWGSEPTVDQTYDASSENAQSGTAVAEAVTSVDKVSTSQASATEIDIAVKGNAPLTLIAEDYGSMPGPSTSLSFSSAEYISTQGGTPMYGIHVVFDLPSAQTLPISARITVNQDIVGSDTRYRIDFVRFGEAVDDFVSTSQAYTVDINGMISSETTLLAGNYDVTLSAGNPGYSFTQVGFVIQGAGQDTAWSDFVNYIITNASTLFSMSVPTTVKSARLLPAASSNDADKVLTVNASGKPGWATPATVTVDQTYDATSTNAQSGKAVAEAVGTSTNLAAGKHITLSEFDGALHIGADDQLPYYDDTFAGKVLTVDSSGVPVWAVGSSKLTKLFGTVTNNEITGTAKPILEPGYYQVNLMFDMTQYVSQFAFIKFGVDYGSQSREMSEQLVPVDITSNGPFVTGSETHIRTGYLEISGTAEGLIADFVDWGGNAPSASLPITTATFYAVKIADLPY